MNTGTGVEGASKPAGVCRVGTCRTIGQLRALPSLQGVKPDSGRATTQPASTLEVCGTHWPEVRERLADPMHWRAAMHADTLVFEAVPPRSYPRP